MSGRLVIIGGGLTGVLAALEGHRLGWRDIVLHERFEALGGVALPKVNAGSEMRSGCIYFGGPEDPIVKTLQDIGARFETFDNRFASVAPGPDGARLVCTDFGGPALDCEDFTDEAPAGPSLAHRLGAYPPQIAMHLARYCQWALDGADPSTLDADCVTPLAINRVFPAGADIEALAGAKRSNRWTDELYAIPRQLWGRTDNLTASLPVDGFAGLFETCRKALTERGVEVRLNSLIPPRQALDETGRDDVIVWAANPTLLFKPVGLTPPRLLRKVFTSLVFEADFDGPCPAYVQNFTAEGDVFRAYVYRSGGQTLVTAECVREADALAVADQLPAMLASFGALSVGPVRHVAVEPRWIFHTLEAMSGLKSLRSTLAGRLGDRFVAGAWEPYSKAAKLAEVNASLARARRAVDRPDEGDGQLSLAV